MDKELAKLVVEIRTDQQKLKRELTGLKTNMDKTAQKVGNSFTQKLTSSMKKLGGVIAGAFATEQIVRVGYEMVQLAAKAEGVKNAFAKLNDPNLLKNLNNATRRTVSDLQLMQVSVKAKNFKIPLDQLATLLEFAQKRANQTGESVDYLVDSIINGIGRKSALVLDNLGISMTELQQEVAKVGDFAVATGNIVRRELKSMGDVALTTADKIAQAQKRLDDLKVKGGNVLIMLNDKSAQWVSSWYNSVGILYKKLIGEPLDRMLQDDVPNKIKQITTKVRNSINGVGLIGGTATVGTQSGFLEGLKAYYDVVKFSDKQYYNFRKNMIQQELIDMEKAGLAKVQLKIYENNQLKQLDKEYAEYVRGNRIGFGNLAGKGLQMQSFGSGTPTELGGKDQWYVDLWQSKGKPDMEEQKNLWGDIQQAQQVAMGNLISNWASAIKLFEKANSMLQQFLNMLAQVAMQEIAMAAVKFAGNLITSGGSSVVDAASNVTSTALNKTSNSQAVTNALLIENNQLQAQMLNKKMDTDLKGNDIRISYNKTSERVRRYY